MLPPQERFGADAAGVAQIDDRLEEQAQLATLERSVQGVLGRMHRDGSNAHRVVEHLDAAAAAVLGVVHRRVGVAQHIFRAFVTFGRECDPDAGADEHLRAPNDHGSNDVGQQALRDLGGEIARGVGLQVLAENRELVAAESRDRVARPDQRLELARHLDQQLVARVVPEAVVDVLEAVEVEERHADVRLRARAARDRLAEPVDEQQPVRKARERVVHRLVGQPLLEGLALDRDRRELREQEEDLLVLLVGESRFGVEDVERAEHRAAVARDDRHRPRRPQPVLLRHVTPDDPAIVVGDVAHVDGPVEERGRTARTAGRVDRRAFEHFEERRGEARRAADAHATLLLVDEHDRARAARKVMFERGGDRPQRLGQRDAACDLLEDLGLAGREVGRAPLLGHVVSDRLDLDDLAVGVEEGAVGPLVPAQ